MKKFLKGIPIGTTRRTGTHGRRRQEDAGDRLRVSNGMAWGKDKERSRQAHRWWQKEAGRTTGWLEKRGGTGGNRGRLITEEAVQIFSKICQEFPGR